MVNIEETHEGSFGGSNDPPSPANLAVDVDRGNVAAEEVRPVPPQPSGPEIAPTFGESQRKRKRIDLEITNRSPICYTCGVGFGDWIGLIGHLRSHRAGPELTGDSPFPFYGFDDFPFEELGANFYNEDILSEILSQTLPTIAEELAAVADDNHDSSASAEVGPSSSGKKPLNFDLNELPPPEDGGDNAGSAAA